MSKCVLEKNLSSPLCVSLLKRGASVRVSEVDIRRVWEKADGNAGTASSMDYKHLLKTVDMSIETDYILEITFDGDNDFDGITSAPPCLKPFCCSKLFFDFRGLASELRGGIEEAARHYDTRQKKKKHSRSLSSGKILKLGKKAMGYETRSSGSYDWRAALEHSDSNPPEYLGDALNELEVFL